MRRWDGGAEGIRTPDLLIANETLYQLSYDPIQQARKYLQCLRQIARTICSFSKDQSFLIRLRSEAMARQASAAAYGLSACSIKAFSRGV
jgi:hypothetical protein